MEVQEDRGCFVCGPDNPSGLNARFEQDAANRSAHCTIRLPGTFQGWQGIVHGGILATLLDETAIYACRTEEEQVVTAEIQVKYRQPARIGIDLVASAVVRERKRKVFTVEAMLHQEGQLVAEAEVKIYALRGRNGGE